jgi:Carboxypeptidase regulatory-like domain/TonB-dependent Receptor Plug Domain
LNQCRVLLLSLACALAPLVKAQVTGSITGKVEDASGAAVSSATITVKSLETGATRTTTTDENGNFNVPLVPIGAQELRAEKKGFKAAVRTGIDLEVGQQAVVNFHLEVGDLAQQLTVTEDAPAVNTTTQSVSGVVNEQQVKDLPLNGRSFDNLITLNPGAVNYTLKSAGTSTSNGNTFSVEGRRTSENLFLLNGIEYTGSSQLAVTPGGVSGELLGIDAVREFNVLTDTYDAEYGKRAGAQVIVVTQSGTNALHGTVYEFLRNSDLDARNFFDQAHVPPYRRNQFGAAAGAPIKKNRAFFFTNYEGYRQALALSSLSVVPDAEARQGLLPNAGGVYTPVANLNPAILPYMSFWPAPNGPELTVNGLPSGTAESFNNPRQHIREDFGTLRNDYILGARDTLSTSYTIDDGNNLTPNADPLFGSYSTLRAQVASVQETRVISPWILNTFTAGFSRAGFAYDSVPLATYPANLDFVENAGPGGIVVGGGTSTASIAAITSAGPGNAAGVWNRRNLFTYTDGVTMTHGIHQISAGVWFQRMQDNEDSASRQLGVATFTSLATFEAATVSTFQVVPTANELGWRSLFGAWYVEDAIRLRPNLTISLGVRDEFTTGWNEVSGRAANFITDSNGILETAPRIASGVFTQNNATHLFAPRVGLAWDPFKDGKTAIRAGFGTYYSLMDALAFQLNALPPSNPSITFTGNLFGFLPIVPNQPIPPACGPNIPAGTTCTTYAPTGVQANAETPAVQEWNFMIERELFARTTLRVAYVGSHGYHGLLNIDPNSIPAEICTNSAGCVSGGTPGTTKGLVPDGAQYIPVTTRPNPYLSGGFFWYTEGNSSYNALQTDVIHRLSHGLQFRGNFTWGKNLDMNSGLTGAQASNEAQMILNRNDLPLDWGPSALNIAYQGSISLSYQLPGFRSSNRLIGGWQTNLITTLLSGFPLTPQIGSNRSGDGDTRNPDRPNVNPSFTGPVIIGSPTEWFNPNAFVLPTPGTYGNLGRGVYDGPGLAETDFSLFKNTHLSERTTLQLRSEFFNIFNRPNFSTPNAVVFSGTNISPSAGLITATATTSRQIQFGLKLIF